MTVVTKWMPSATTILAKQHGSKNRSQRRHEAASLLSVNVEMRGFNSAIARVKDLSEKRNAGRE